MAIIKCPECGHQVSDQAKTCPSCGIEIAGKVTRCPDCGEIVFKNQAMCPACHCPISGSPDVGQPAPGQPVADMGQPAAVASADSSRQTAEEEQQPKPKRTYAALIVAFVIALAIVFVGVYFYKNVQDRNELAAYENAMQSSEPGVLQNFLDMYTEAPAEHIDSISVRLERLKQIDADWNNVVVSNSKTALERYILLHPGSVHVVEAKIKIDSLDWISATVDDTPEAYQKYMTQHGDGAYFDEAKAAYEKVQGKTVSADDKQLVSQLFTTYFRALSSKDETSLTATLNSILTSFLHKANASKSDVISYMNKLYAPEDINNMTFTLNNDWKIEKQEAAEGGYEYSVAFTVDQKIDRADKEKETFNTYKVTAKVSAVGKISDLNMQKVVQ